MKAIRGSRRVSMQDIGLHVCGDAKYCNCTAGSIFVSLQYNEVLCETIEMMHRQILDDRDQYPTTIITCMACLALLCVKQMLTMEHAEHITKQAIVCPQVQS